MLDGDCRLSSLEISGRFRAVTLEARSDEILFRVLASARDGLNMVAACSAILEEREHGSSCAVLIVIAASRLQPIKQLQRRTEEDGFTAVQAVPTISIPDSKLQ